jgi:hypothetical protein
MIDSLYLFVDLSSRFTTSPAPSGCTNLFTRVVICALDGPRPLRSHHSTKMCTAILLSISWETTWVQETTTSSIARRIRRTIVVDLFIRLTVLRPSPLCKYRRVGSFACSGVTCMVLPASVVPATENRDIVRYLRNLSVSLLEGNRTPDLRELQITTCICLFQFFLSVSVALMNPIKRQSEIAARR